MNNKARFKKIFGYISKLFSSAMLVLLVIVGIFLVYYLVTSRMVSKNPNIRPRINLYTIVSGSMEPAIKVYDVILDFAVTNPDSIKVGDVITFKSTSNISRDLIVTHRVIDKKIVNGKVEYVTKGDYNPVADNDTAKFENVIGKVVFRLPQLGRIQFFLATKMGWILVVMLPAIGVIIYDIIKLIKLLGVKKNTTSIETSDTSIKNGPNYYSDSIDETLEQIKKSDYMNKLNSLKSNN